MNEDTKQDIFIDVLKNQFNELKEVVKACALKEDVIKQQGLIDNHCVRVRALENNTAVAKEILKNVNDCVHKLAKQLDAFREQSITRQQLDRLIEVNQADIIDNRKRIRDLEIQQATSWTKLSIVWAGITIIGISVLAYIIDIFKKHFGG